MLDIAIDQAEAEETAEGFHKLHYVLNGVELAEKGFEVIELAADAAGLLESTRLGEGLLEQAQRTGIMSGVARASLVVGVAGIFAQYIGFWMQLGGAYAEARATIARDHLLRGLSYGVVLGANRAGPNYVKSNFWLNARPSYPAMREYEETAQNLQNTALVSGYQQGKSLSDDEIRSLFSDLHARMDGTDQEYYSNEWSEWSAEKRREYYILCAALFRRDHLE